MWEFCIAINNNNHDLFNFILDKLSEYVKQYDGIVTVLENNKYSNILIACNMYEKNRLVLFLQDILSESICCYYKKEYLENYLNICVSDIISKNAFISALLYFDKETDRYIVNKYLNIDKKINIDGFFNFRLQTLKQKWYELISIANQNEVYLYSDDTFIELIKFLVDNIEVKSDVINIMSSDDSYDIFDEKFDKIQQNNKVCEENLIGLLIAFCPKSINIYCSEALSNKNKNLICKLFEKRVKFVSN